MKEEQVDDDIVIFCLGIMKKTRRRKKLDFRLSTVYFLISQLLCVLMSDMEYRSCFLARKTLRISGFVSF